MNPIIAILAGKALIQACVVKKFWPKSVTVSDTSKEPDKVPEGLHEYRKIGEVAFARITDQSSGLELWRCRSFYKPDRDFSRGCFSSMDEFIEYIQTIDGKEG